MDINIRKNNHQQHCEESSSSNRSNIVFKMLYQFKTLNLEIKSNGLRENSIKTIVNLWYNI